MHNVVKIVVIFALIGSAGCVTSREIYTSSGEIGHSINCSGEALTWGACFEEAGDLCGNEGYTVLEQVGDQGAYVSGGSQATAYSSSSAIYGGTIHTRSLIVKCGSSP